MSLRSLGRWLYHAITSSDKRPYLGYSLEQLESIADKSSSSSDVFKLFGIFDELTYRITSPKRRDRLKKKISDQLRRIEGIKLPIQSNREKVSEIRAQLLSKYAEKAEAERKAREAAAEKERLEAEAKAQQEEAERKEAERKAREAAAEKERLDAEAKAQQEEAERKAREAAAEQARLEAEARAQQEEAERKEAERKAREAAAEKERLDAEAKAQREAEEKARLEAAAKQAGREDQKEREEDSTAAEPASEEKPPRQQDLQEQIKRFFAARPLTEAKQPRKKEEEPDSQAELSQPTLEDEGICQNEENAATADDLTAREAEKLIDESRSDLEAQKARTDASRDEEAADQLRQKYAPSRRQLKRSAEEIREERRELARLRRLEREGREADQSEDELVGAELDVEFEQAEQFAPYLRAIPAHWSDWSEQHWNIKLLDYCFVQRANDNASQGIPSTEEDLAFVTGDRESAPAEIAQALVKRVRDFSVNHGLSPARLLAKRLETWDYKSPSPPRYFAFLWTTCLIAQGFPSPFEQGEFHRRYERDDVYGANESQFLSGNLPAAWEQLSKWLDRDDVFDAEAHRRLILPKTDLRRSIISHSWKLSFPCRSDRKRLHDLLGRVKSGKASPAIADLKLISMLLYQGKFTPEFTAALKQQIDLVQKGDQMEEWLSAIIQREIESQGISQAVAGRRGKPETLKGISPKVMLHLDDEDCYLELVLPGQSVVVEKSRRLSQKTYCAISLESKERLPQVVGEFDLDKGSEGLIIPELRVKIEGEHEEYALRLRHQGLDDAVLAEWNCEGLPSSKPYILFNSETNQIINDAALRGNTLFLLFRRHWDVVLSDGIEAEGEEPISVSRPRGWLLLELAKTSPPQESETISLTNATGERFDICWVDPDVEKSNSRPLLQGLSIPGQTNRIVMLPESPELWLPPAVTDAEIEMYKIEDDEFFMPIGSIQVPSTESWQQAGVRSIITGPGHYSIRLSYFDNLSESNRRWSKQVLIVEEPDIESIYPTPLQARYSYKDRLKVLDLERDVSPLVFQETQAFWNAEWLIHGLWAHEKMRVRLDGDGESHSPVLSADNSGSCKIPISAFEPYLLSKESARLSIQRQGFICQYDLAVLIGSSSNRDQATKEEQRQPTAELRKRPAQRRRTIDTVDLVVNGDRSYEIQKMIVDELNDLIKEHLGHLESWAIDYPDGKKAPGRRFVFHKVSFAGMENDARKKFRIELDSMISSIGREYSLAFSAEWSRARE